MLEQITEEKKEILLPPGTEGFRDRDPSIYKLSAKRKWQWIRNLIDVGVFHQEKTKKQTSKGIVRFINLVKNMLFGIVRKLLRFNNPTAEAQILNQFIISPHRKKILQKTDLSFDRNLVPLRAGDAYIDESAFSAYLQNLAPHRHYHLFAHFLFSVLQRNSMSTLDLLKNLLLLKSKLEKPNLLPNDYQLLYSKDKSQQWIGSLMCRVLSQPPSSMLDCLEVSGELSLSDKQVLQGDFLFCDDIAYSGTQAGNTLDSFFHYAADHPDKEIHLIMAFSAITNYALEQLKERIDVLKTQWGRKDSVKKLTIQIVYGSIIPNFLKQLESLKFPPESNEQQIIAQLLYCDPAHYADPLSDFRKPLLTTAWKKPDPWSIYHNFVGLSNMRLISAQRMPNPPSKDMTVATIGPEVPALTFICGPETRDKPYGFKP